jgi:hypothetical protein
MEATDEQVPENLLDSTFRIPQEVVYRTFAHETVVLNLKTGRYHGLNPTAGMMLTELERGVTAREAAAVLAAHFERPVAEIEDDLSELCRDLLARHLIEVSSSAGGGPDGS